MFLHVFTFTHVGMCKVLGRVQIREAMFDVFTRMGVVVLFHVAFGIKPKHQEVSRKD